MTYYDIGIIPDEKDLSGFMGVGGSLSPKGTPSIRITQHVTVQFQPEDREFAIRYLTKLGNEALKLAEQIAEQITAARS